MGSEVVAACDAVDQLAEALRLQRHQICLRVGSLTEAARIAREWAAGDMTLDEVTALLEKISPAWEQP